MTTERTIEKLIEEFNIIGGWEDRYAHIISMGRMLKPYPEEFRTEEFKVQGCTSQLWLYPRFVEGKLQFDADSDAVIVKGLVAMLLRIYNNRSPKEILAVAPDFVNKLELNNHLSPSRANGLASMMRDIMRYAVAYSSAAEEYEAAHAAEQASADNATATAGDQSSTTSAGQADVGGLRDKVIDALHTVFDPEIPIDIYELGLIYEVRVSPAGAVHILMTLTTPNCPSAQSLPVEVDEVTRAVPGVTSVEVEITFDPPWDRTMMSEAALFSMGLF